MEPLTKQLALAALGNKLQAGLEDPAISNHNVTDNPSEKELQR